MSIGDHKETSEIAGIYMLMGVIEKALKSIEESYQDGREIPYTVRSWVSYEKVIYARLKVLSETA